LTFSGSVTLVGLSYHDEAMRQLVELACQAFVEHTSNIYQASSSV